MSRKNREYMHKMSITVPCYHAALPCIVVSYGYLKHKTPCRMLTMLRRVEQKLPFNTANVFRSDKTNSKPKKAPFPDLLPRSSWGRIL